MNLQQIYNRSINCAQTLLHDGSRVLDHFMGTAENIIAAIHHPEAMPERQRQLDEFKLGAGLAMLGFGALELSPVTIAGSAIPAVEAANELSDAGHQWRVRHGMRL